MGDVQYRLQLAGRVLAVEIEVGPPARQLGADLDLLVRRLRRLEQELARSDDDLARPVERDLAANLLPIDKRAVAAAEILEEQAIVLACDAGVTAADVGKVDMNGDAGLAADYCFAVLEGKAFAGGGTAEHQ